MKYIILGFLVIFFINGCSTKEFKVLDIDDSKVKELNEIPQDVSYYLNNYKDNNKLKESQKTYISKYYKIWIKKPNIKVSQAFWAFKVYNKKRNYYGVNLKLYDENFYKKNYYNANIKDYMTLNKKALTLHVTNLRAFPTDDVLFINPNKAGEGFPFDYLQNSLISSNKPLYVSHISKDRKWAFVFSSFTSGWVKLKDIVFIDNKEAKVWMNAKQVFIHKENQKVIKDSNYILTYRLGMLLPYIGEDSKKYKVLAVLEGNNNQANFTQISIDKKYASLEPLIFNKKNIKIIISQLQKSKYGWGGMYKQRDCSSSMRDFFAPFGIWLPRNSSAQSKIGKVIKLSNLDNDEKKELILKQGIPFETLVYKKGHIALYVGSYNNEPIIFQNVWGIKTKNDKKTGRIIIGRSIFSTLELGKDLDNVDKESLFLQKLKSINIVTAVNSSSF